MSKPLLPQIAGAALALLAAGSIAQTAPGVDTVSISKPVTYLQVPTARVAPSGDIHYDQTLPDNLSAKVARYTAKAYSSYDTNVKTDRDVVQSVKTNGLQTTCTQSVGSVTAPAGAGGVKLGNNDQIVVLRGDLVNICN
ncbi:MAG: hypothetical protein JSS17_02335 [Proteobacteria bacterium]|nr:hypothetical protein [Pseudomonadota bacterium]